MCSNFGELGGSALRTDRAILGKLDAAIEREPRGDRSGEHLEVCLIAEVKR